MPTLTKKGTTDMLSSGFRDGLHLVQQSKLRSNFRQQETTTLGQERKRLAKTLQYLDQLQAAMESRATAIDALSGELRSILTPGQTVRYLLWIERNRHRILQCGLDQGFIPRPEQASPIDF